MQRICTRRHTHVVHAVDRRTDRSACRAHARGRAGALRADGRFRRIAESARRAARGRIARALGARHARAGTRDGETRIVDGPFAEAKEMVGGFFLVDVETRDEALDIARACPAAQWCTVEVRAVGPCFL
ncbi:YciI family protein [Burkholderia multivorans]|nr:YciI family protein [Burkholderia multivorans]UQO45716.1 YciI family protein [Burkholderia multivorans]